MLSDEEKKEMLEDGLNLSRRDHFRMLNAEFKKNASIDEYIKFLDDIQKVFGQFKISEKFTKTDLNKL